MWNSYKVQPTSCTMVAREGTYIAGDVPRGLGTFDGNSISSQVIVLHL